MDVKDVLATKRTRELLDNEAGRLLFVETVFQPDADLVPFWSALEKPTPLLRRILLRIKPQDKELTLLHPGKKLFGDYQATCGPCSLLLWSCIVPVTMVATHKLTELQISANSSSSLTTKELARWWSVCVDGVSMPSLLTLTMTMRPRYNLKFKEHPESLSLLSANPRPRLPPKLEWLFLETHAENLAILLEKVQVPSSCKRAEFEFMMGERSDNDVSLIETLSAIFSRFWERSVRSQIEYSHLEIADAGFLFHYKPVGLGDFKIEFGWSSPSHSSYAQLIKELLDRMASEEHFPNLRSFSPDSVLMLQSTCAPYLASYLHESLMGLLRTFDEVRQLGIGPFDDPRLKPPTEEMNAFRSRIFSSMSTYNTPEGERPYLPNLQKVSVGQEWLASETLVNTLNQFAATRDRIGAPVIFEAYYYSHKTPNAILQMPLAIPGSEKKIEESREPREETEGTEGADNQYAEEDEGAADAENEEGERHEDAEQGEGYGDDEEGGHEDKGVAEGNDNEEGEGYENGDEGQEYADDEEGEAYATDEAGEGCLEEEVEE
jgi:hypothetical protein